MKEHSLIVFTLLSQVAAGTFCLLMACLLWFLSFATLEQAYRWSTPGFLLAAVLMAAAMGTSFFHLGNPHSAWRAASNLRTSWLSREIALVLVFTGCAAVFAAMVGLGIAPLWLLISLGVVSALIGLCLVYTMSRVYCQRTVPAWDTWHTPVIFLLSALSIGTAAASLILALNAGIPPQRLVEIGRLMAALLAVLLVLQVAGLISWLNPAVRTGAYRESLALLTGRHRGILTAHLVLLGTAVLAAGIWLALGFDGSRLIREAALWLTVLLVFAAQVPGRLLFYLARVRQGV
jgi:anaerobic dimethyl sulfoxide reductase subunit C (anchor subunit)